MFCPSYSILCAYVYLYILFSFPKGVVQFGRLCCGENWGPESTPFVTAPIPYSVKKQETPSLNTVRNMQPQLPPAGSGI